MEKIVEFLYNVLDMHNVKQKYTSYILVFIDILKCTYIVILKEVTHQKLKKCTGICTMIMHFFGIVFSETNYLYVL